MKLLPAALAVCSAACGLYASDASVSQLKQIQSVYILPMRGGMDQYLANRITREGLFVVVADPQRADAIVTDRLGEPLERKLDELYPPPKPVKVEKKEAADKDSADKDKAAAAKDSSDSQPNDDLSAMAATAGFDHPSTFGRGKGTIFVVDRRSRAVLWSTYDRPHDMRADTLDKNADQIVRRLKRDLKETKPAPAQ
jgi:hypothetical protein